MKIRLFAAFCFLAAAQTAWADWTVLSVSRIEATRNAAPARYPSSGVSSIDNTVINQQIDDIAGFNVSGNVLTSSLISINSQTDTDIMGPGITYIYYGSFDSDVVSIQFQVTQPQPFSFSYTGSDELILPNLVSLTPGIAVNDWLNPYNPSYSASGILQPGIYTLTADWGYDTDPSSPLESSYQDFVQNDNLVLSVPEPTCFLLVAGGLVIILRRRWSLARSPRAACSL